MKRAFWLGVLALSGCGDPSAEFNDAALQLGGAATSGMAAGGTTTAGDDTGGTSAGTSSNGGVATGGTLAAGGAATGGNVATGGAVAAGGDPSGGDLATGGTGMPGAGTANGGARDANAGAPSVSPDDTLDLIDDMEGAFPSLPLRAGRDGSWFSAQDETNGYVSEPTAVDLVPARGASHVGAGISGGGFTDWGAQLGVLLRASSEGYDASRYCGLHFWAKGSGSGWTLLMSDHSSMPEGGACNADDLDGADGCYHFVGKSFSVSNDWRELVVGFDQLRFVDDPNSARRLEPNEVYTILFNFYSPNGNAFELVVDDISFIAAGSAICP